MSRVCYHCTTKPPILKLGRDRGREHEKERKLNERRKREKQDNETPKRDIKGSISQGGSVVEHYLHANIGSASRSEIAGCSVLICNGLLNQNHLVFFCILGKRIDFMLRGAVAAHPAHNRESPGSIPGRSGKKLGDFSDTPRPCPPRSEWVPGINRGLCPVSWALFPSIIPSPPVSLFFSSSCFFSSFF